MSHLNGAAWKLELGAEPGEGAVRFRVWAPRAASVSLAVESRPAEIPMTREAGGYFTALVPGLAAGDRYFYLLDGRRRPDPVSRFQPAGVHGPSEVVDPRRDRWADAGWKGIRLEDAIFYEIHTGTFTPRGTFEALIPFLPYLRRELGVTAVELMPVAQFPGERNWGYDGVSLFAPQNSYGGPRGLKALVDASHELGLAVILDVVYNHLGPEGNYLGEFGPYFTDRCTTPWGQALNYDGPESDEVRRFVIGNALYWVKEYHVDGLRIDAVQGLLDFSPRHILADIRQAVDRLAEAEGRHILVVAESDLEDPRVIDPPRRGGYGVDAQWNDDFHHCLHALLTGERRGYYEDFGDIRQLAKAVRDGFVFTGQYSRFRRRAHGRSSRHLPPSKFIVFSQNHDQAGNRAGGERLASLAPFEALKLAAGSVLLAPQIPLLFMGEEYGETAPFRYFTSYSDRRLAEAVREARRAEYKGLPAGAAVHDPLDESVFRGAKLDLSLRSSGDHALLLGFYRRLIRLRQERRLLHEPSKKGLRVRTLTGRRALLVDRDREGERLVCIFNFEPRPVEFELDPAGAPWLKILDSSERLWGGPGVAARERIEAKDPPGVLALPAYGLVVYEGVAATEEAVR